MTTASPQAPCLAIFGTGSDVGKSIIVTGLCRYFANQGVRVAPYKAQNMSNNAGVTPEGLEMGRAQIVQAEAARIPPHVDMNPILLKPTSDIGAQVILLGQAVTNASAMAYHQEKEALQSATDAALDRLRNDFELIIIEGAGSCAEVNLMPHDIVNFRTAETANAPVILVADIHRGGVFAQVVGTLACLPQDKRERVTGFMVNRFRGDLDLFRDGVKWIEKETGKPSFGVVPWYDHFHIEAEDSVAIEQPQPVRVTQTNRPALAVIRLPHIANFTDFDPLAGLDGVDLYYVERPQALSMFKAIILPGSKNTRFDLDWLKKSGWADVLIEYEKNNGCLLGICGGYQMMGHEVHDPDGLEGVPGSSAGLGLLPVVSTLKAPKTTTLTRFVLPDGTEGTGYEIHMGHTKRLSGEPMATIVWQNGHSVNEPDGCRLAGRSTMGSYLHGLFDTPGILDWWLTSIGLTGYRGNAVYGPRARDRHYDLLADHLATHCDLKKIEALI